VSLDVVGQFHLGVVRDVADEYEESEATSAALALVGTLPPDQAEAIVLRVVAELDAAQTARLLGKSPGAVRVLTHRGLRRLARIVTDEMIGEGVKR
jgi:RNA polymerase sigma-70 factor (ECF subfamily)